MLEPARTLELEYVSEPFPRISLADGETTRTYYALKDALYERVYQPDSECAGEQSSFELIRNNGSTAWVVE